MATIFRCFLQKEIQEGVEKYFFQAAGPNSILPLLLPHKEGSKS